MRPFTDGSSAYVFRQSPPAVFILDALSWTILYHCDHKSLEEVQRWIAAATEHLEGSDVFHEMCGPIVEELEERGLITILLG